MPPISSLPLRRLSNQYILIAPNKRPATYAASSHHAISDEIWSMIKHYSESKEKGKQLAKKNGILKVGDQEQAWLAFRAFIRQAESYFEIAQQTHTRSAALLYYYSFLNILKGGLVIKNKLPSRANGSLTKIKHGLNFKSDSVKPFNQLTVSSMKDGIFPLFYDEYFTNRKPSKQPLNLVKLLSYCSDITTQYELSGYGSSKIHPVYYAIVSNGQTKKSWELIGVRHFEVFRPYGSFINTWLENYTQVDVPRAEIKELFGLNAWAAQDFSFFQSKTEYEWIGDETPYPPTILAKDFAERFTNFYRINVYGDDPAGFLIEPYAPRNQMPFDELTAIYVSMFSLSNLIRYNPAYIEKLLESTDSWMMENFIKYTPQMFLRSVAGWIMGQDFILSRR